MSKQNSLSFEGQDLRHRSFKGSDLRGANFKSADVRGCNFSEANLKSADFDGAVAGTTSSKNNILNAAATSASVVSLAGFAAPVIGMVATIVKIIFDKNDDGKAAKVAGAAFFVGPILGLAAAATASGLGVASESKQSFSTCFTLANLTNANLQGLSLQGSDFSGANLTNVDLSNTNISDANFISTNLADASLSGVQAANTNFSRAILTGACIENWGINSQTLFKDVTCNYIYFKGSRGERKPEVGTFKVSEFERLIVQSQITVDFLMQNGVEPQAFLSQGQKLDTARKKLSELKRLVYQGDAESKIQISSKDRELAEALLSDEETALELITAVLSNEYTNNQVFNIFLRDERIINRVERVNYGIEVTGGAFTANQVAVGEKATAEMNGNP